MTDWHNWLGLLAMIGLVVVLVLIERRYLKLDDKPQFDAETIKTLQARKTCDHCGGWHVRSCPRVKRLRFAETNGKLVEVEFWQQWSTEGIVFPEDIEDAEPQEATKS